MGQGEHGLRISGDGNTRICYGVGDPNSAVNNFVNSAGPGSLYLRLDGSTSTTLYVCVGTQFLSTTGTVALWQAK
jgi:hypothetical protein